MTLVAYTKTNASADHDLLWSKVNKAFPSTENREYFDEIRSRKNQDSIRESLSALLVLAELLNRASTPTTTLIFGRQESGKPHFKNSQIEFSVSHSHGYATAIISDDSKVGIDIEATEISPEKAAKLAERFFSADEKRELVANPDSFLRIWTKKEAFAKMHGTPLSDLIASEKNLPTGKRENAAFCELSANGHPMTVCLEKPCEITTLGEIII